MVFEFIERCYNPIAAIPGLTIMGFRSLVFPPPPCHPSYKALRQHSLDAQGTI